MNNGESTEKAIDDLRDRVAALEAGKPAAKASSKQEGGWTPAPPPAAKK
jgi:hypothetical protein